MTPFAYKLLFALRFCQSFPSCCPFSFTRESTAASAAKDRKKSLILSHKLAVEKE